MGKLVQQLAEPISSIRNQLWSFRVWLIVVIGFGLAGLWVPTILALATGRSAVDMFTALVYGGTLASFSIVLLADGIASAMNVVGAGSNSVAAAMRALVVIAAIFLVLLEAVVLESTHLGGAPAQVSVLFQVVLMILSVGLASYLYCFRFPRWEKGVAEVKEKEDREVESLGESAQAKDTDEGGAKL